MCFCDFVTNRNAHRFVSHLGPGMNLKKFCIHHYVIFFELWYISGVVAGLFNVWI